MYLFLNILTPDVRTVCICKTVTLETSQWYNNYCITPGNVHISSKDLGSQTGSDIEGQF